MPNEKLEEEKKWALENWIVLDFLGLCWRIISFQLTSSFYIISH